MSKTCDPSASEIAPQWSEGLEVRDAHNGTGDWGLGFYGLGQMGPKPIPVESRVLVANSKTRESQPSLASCVHTALVVHYLATVKTSLRFTGHFTLWPKVERSSIATNQIARNQEFGLSTLHTKVKVQRSLQFKMIIF